MAEIAIFEYSNYRHYLEDILKSPAFGRGGRAHMAQHLNCQPSYVSQVLKGKSSLSLEQAFKVNTFLRHNPLQREYFMVLVEMDRAGTLELKQYYSTKRAELSEKSKLIENQMSYDQLSEADAVAYYSNWNNVLIRNLIDIPTFKTVEALKKKLNISEESFAKAFDFLVEKGLIRINAEGLLEQGHTRLHIKKQSPLAKFGHISTRLQMIKNYEKLNNNSLNYSSNVTLPRSSYEEFKKRFAALIVDLNAHLDEKQPAEMMATLVIDFMEI